VTNSTHSESLLSDLLRHLTSVRSLKQLFITVVLMSNAVGLYDLVLNQGRGLNALVSTYRSLNPNTIETPIITSDDLKYITKVVSDYPGSRISILQLVPDTGLEPVSRTDTPYRLAIYEGGRPVALLLIDAPTFVKETLYYYFRGYETYSPILEPTPK
jgi:hypothetical protein